MSTNREKILFGAWNDRTGFGDIDFGNFKSEKRFSLQAILFVHAHSEAYRYLFDLQSQLRVAKRRLLIFVTWSENSVVNSSWIITTAPWMLGISADTKMAICRRWHTIISSITNHKRILVFILFRYFPLILFFFQVLRSCFFCTYLCSLYPRYRQEIRKTNTFLSKSDIFLADNTAQQENTYVLHLEC